MRNQTGWENEQSSGLCQERKSICQNRRILSGSNHQEVEDQNPEELRTTGCLMNRYSLCTAVYGKLRKASEFWRRISKRDQFLWRNRPVFKVISSSVISHWSFSGIWNTCSAREDYLFLPRRSRMPFVQRTWPRFPTWGKTERLFISRINPMRISRPSLKPCPFRKFQLSERSETLCAGRYTFPE